MTPVCVLAFAGSSLNLAGKDTRSLPKNEHACGFCCKAQWKDREVKSFPDLIAPCTGIVAPDCIFINLFEQEPWS
jgi:hypothetical protein